MKKLILIVFMLTGWLCRAQEFGDKQTRSKTVKVPIGEYLIYGAPLGVSADTIMVVENDTIKKFVFNPSSMALVDLTDVNNSGLFDGAILKYNLSSGFWEFATDQISGASGATQLSELTDVSSANPTNRNVLIANGSLFSARALTEADISDFGNYQPAGSYASLSHNHAISDVTNLQTQLDSKSSTSHNHTLDALSNTVITSVANGELLYRSGSNWINGTPQEIGLQPAGSYALTSHLHDDRYYTETESDARYLGISANAATASRLLTGRTISLGTDLSGSVVFDGSTNITLNASVLDDSHKHIISNVDGLQAALDSKLGTGQLVAAGSTTIGGIAYNGTTKLTNRLYGGNTLPSTTSGYLNYDGPFRATRFEGSATLGTMSAGTSSFLDVTNSTNKDNGAVIITSGGLGVEGNINAGGDVTAFSTSDIRLKNNIEEIKNAMSIIREIKAISFDWDQEKQSLYTGHDYGFIAQNINEALPSSVREGSSGYLQVNYTKVIPFLVQALKEQDSEISRLKSAALPGSGIGGIMLAIICTLLGAVLGTKILSKL